MTYKQLYETTHGEVEDGWEIHHIDWNHHNDVIDNLIAIPKKVHQLIHNYLGYTTREEGLLLTDLFLSNKNYKTKSISYLNFKLGENVDTNKTSELGISCKGRIGEKVDRYYKMIKGGYREKYKDGVKLYKAVGQLELDLIKESGKFPPRRKGQDTFHPVLSHYYAAKIGENWTVNHELSDGVSYILEFKVDGLYFLKQKVHDIGGLDQELWIPSNKLDEFNDSIIDDIHVVAEYRVGWDRLTQRIVMKRLALEREIDLIIGKLGDRTNPKTNKPLTKTQIKKWRTRITEAKEELVELNG